MNPRTLPQQRPKHLSYVEAVKSGILTGANSLPIKQKFCILVESNRLSSKQSIFDRSIFPKDAWGSCAVPPDQHFLGQAQSSVRKNLVNREKPVNSERGKAADSSLMDLNLNLGLGTSHPPTAIHPAQNLPWTGNSRICSRCLSNSHSRSGCKFKIRCHKCLRGGHIAANCIGQQRLDRNMLRTNQWSKWSKGKAHLEQPKWFSNATSVPLGPSTSSPPTFSSFADWWSAGLALQMAPQLPESRIIPWTLPSKSMNDGPDAFETHREEGTTQINRDAVQSAPLPATPIHTRTSSGTEENFIRFNPIPSDFLGLGQQADGEQAGPNM